MPTPLPRTTRRDHRTKRRRASLVLALLVGTGATGCGREFYRNWADQDVSEAVFEKSRDPRWRFDLFTIEPPPLSRFADPYDPDQPPAPPDDPAAEALSPVPQWPHHRLLIPMEGTGYLELLEAWRRDRPATDDDDEKTAAPGAAAGTASPGSPPAQPVAPAPPADTPAPFQRPTAQPAPDPAVGEGVAPLTPEPAPPAAGNPEARLSPRNPGRVPVSLTPISMKDKPPSPAATVPPQPSRAGTVGHVAAAPKPPLRDPAVQLSATTAGSGLAAPTSLAFVGQDVATPPTRPGQTPAPGVPNPLVPLEPMGDLDPDPVDVDLSRPADPRSGLSPEQYQVAGARTAGLSGLLAPSAIPFDQEEAAGVRKGSNPYVLTPRQAMTLALMNSRTYQSQIEQVYIRSLDVTLTRWEFEPQFIAGLAPRTGTSAGSLGPNFQNSFTYRTDEVNGGNSGTSTLAFGTLAGVGKALSFGGSLLAGFANQVVFNFTGTNALQPRVQSVLPLQYVQPFLRGGGRAVTLEPLTAAERNLLYQVRDFARFRQTFFPSVLTANQAPTISGGGGGGDGNTGYLQVLQQLQVVENNRKTVAAFEQLLKGYVEMSQGGGSGVSQLNVDEIDSNLQQQRQSLIQSLTQYRILLDNYKIQIGLPPDVPIVLDRGLTRPFRDSFDNIDEWFADESRDPADLPNLVETLPALLDVVIDGRSVLTLGKDPHMQEELVLAAERVALENRLELMNGRARLYDTWRALAVTAQDLKGVFDISLTNQYYTPANTSNPFAFADQASQFSLSFNAELPLVRLNERNRFRLALINYRVQQRTLQQQEDQIKLAVRTDVRNLYQSSEIYDIQKRQLVIQLRRKDNSQRVIFAPPESSGAGGSSQVTATTQQLVQAQNGLLSAQNGLISTWVSYTTQRIALYRDLGIIPYDEWEAYYEFFPAESPRSGNRTPGDAARATGGTPRPQPAPERS